MKRRRIVRVAAVAATCVLGTIGLPADPAFALGNGSCGPDDYCAYKNGNKGLPVADWSGDGSVANYNSYEYFNSDNDSPNDEVSWVWNRDAHAQDVYVNSGITGPSTCFRSGYDSTDAAGVENADSSHWSRSRATC